MYNCAREVISNIKLCYNTNTIKIRLYRDNFELTILYLFIYLFSG